MPQHSVNRTLDLQLFDRRLFRAAAILFPLKGGRVIVPHLLLGLALTVAALGATVLEAAEPARSAATASSAAQQPAPAPASHRAAAPQAAQDVAAEVLAFERDIEAAVVRGDVGFVDAASAPTFTFTHGDGWTTGGAPLRVDSRADWLATVARAPYASRVLDSVKTEVHGDVVITYGRYVARFKNAEPGRRRFTVWFERVYAKRDGRWQYLSHRTVHGPVYEKD